MKRLEEFVIFPIPPGPVSSVLLFPSLPSPQMREKESTQVPHKRRWYDVNICTYHRSKAHITYAEQPLRESIPRRSQKRKVPTIPNARDSENCIRHQHTLHLPCILNPSMLPDGEENARKDPIRDQENAFFPFLPSSGQPGRVASYGG